MRFSIAFFTSVLLAAPGWVTLFDGKKLQGWRSGPSVWVVENGTLALRDRTDTKMRNENYLWTADQYGDFVLELEYKVPADRANSGVFIRTEDPSNPVQTGIEIQVGNAHGTPNRGAVGGIYDLVAPTKLVHKSGEWNKYKITANGNRIMIELNGVQTADMDLDRWTEARKNPDGSPNKFRRPLKDFARKGYIGLQDHGSPVRYRNIRIRPLEKR